MNNIDIGNDRRRRRWWPIELLIVWRLGVVDDDDDDEVEDEGEARSNDNDDDDVWAKPKTKTTTTTTLPMDRTNQVATKYCWQWQGGHPIPRKIRDLIETQGGRYLHIVDHRSMDGV